MLSDDEAEDVTVLAWKGVNLPHIETVSMQHRIRPLNRLAVAPTEII